MTNTQDQNTLSRGWTMVSNMLPPVGFFLYFKHRNLYPAKARTALIAAWVGIPIALGMKFVMDTYILH